jgi:3,4-dehydroadipyl-CoA semialdehyde dehydrogenase
VNEVVREMTVKAGQKCTAIRRILVPREQVADAAEAISAGLRLVRVGDPAIPEVGCGPVVNQVQQQEVLRGISELRQESSVIYGGSESFQPEGADHNKGAFVQPTLLSCETPLNCRKVHEVEVFGPVATLLPFHDADEAVALARLAGGSLVASLYADDPSFKEQVVLGIANLYGRIMVVDSSVSGQHTGHGNVMPSCLHGGPGRAGGGSELAGLRALEFYHRRFVMQGPPSLIDGLAATCGSSDQIYR